MKLVLVAMILVLCIAPCSQALGTGNIRLSNGIPNNTTDDWDWKCHHPYDGAYDSNCNLWTNNQNQAQSPLTGNSSNNTSPGNSIKINEGRCVNFTCEIDEPSYQEADVQQVSIYICGHYKNGTAEWCW
jgi:hypothetical protein